jgi:hypothetical protein
MEVIVAWWANALCLTVLLGGGCLKFCDTFTLLLSRLSNIIFDQGIFPTCWSEGIIFPSFKKGDANDTNNYRGITLVSCLSKIFSSVLNDRLLKWSDENNIVSDAQFGFKPGFGTTNAIFALQGVISRTLSRNKKVILLSCRL